MPTIHNPNLRGESPGGPLSRSFLLPVLILGMLVLGYRYLVRPVAVSSPLRAIRARYAALQLTWVPSGSSSAHFGWLSFLAKPLYVALQFTYRHAVPNWGWTIVVLTLCFNLILLWPRIMSMRSALRTARLQPKVDAVRRRYAHLRFDDPKRAAMNSEIMSLYRVEGASMYGGCLPMLLQAPLFLAYMRVLEGATELHGAGWLWIRNLAAPDPLHVLPVLIIVCMALSQWMAPAPGMQPAQRRLLAMATPLVMGVALWHCASGLALYWLSGSVFSLVLQSSFNAAVCSRGPNPLADR